MGAQKAQKALTFYLHGLLFNVLLESKKWLQIRLFSYPQSLF